MTTHISPRCSYSRGFAVAFRRSLLLLFAVGIFCPHVFADQIFTGSLASDWRVLFGTRLSPVFRFELAPTSPVETPPGCHVELQQKYAIGTDFTYGARVTVGDAPGTDAQLQFRISDLGRYGVSVLRDEVRLFVMRPSNSRGGLADWNILGQSPLDPTVSTHTISVTASNFRFDVSVDGVPKISYWDSSSSLRVGAFGLYAYTPRGSSDAPCQRNPNSKVTFEDVKATITGAPASNFALLYSTFGYDPHATKRAFVRTLADISPEKVDLNRSYCASYPTRVADFGSCLRSGNLAHRTKCSACNSGRLIFRGSNLLGSTT